MPQGAPRWSLGPLIHDIVIRVVKHRRPPGLRGARLLPGLQTPEPLHQ